LILSIVLIEIWPTHAKRYLLLQPSTFNDILPPPHVDKFHPKVKSWIRHWAIPYGLGGRLKTKCSKETDYSSHRQLKRNLRKRGYSSKFVDSQLKWLIRMIEKVSKEFSRKHPSSHTDMVEN